MNTLHHIEVELKFPLINCIDTIKKLNLVAKLEKQNDFQKDTYYNPAHRDFLKSSPILEWLRLRESKNSCSFTYKKWHHAIDNKPVSCDEYELKIDSIETFQKILISLDFKELIIVEKSRSVWKYKNTLISIDNVTGLGNFIELEAQGNFSSIEDAKTHLYSILHELTINVGEQDFKGYPYLMLKKKGLL